MSRPRIALVRQGLDPGRLQAVTRPLARVADVELIGSAAELSAGPELVLAPAADERLLEAARGLGIAVWTWLFGEPGGDLQLAYSLSRRYLIARLVSIAPTPTGEVRILQEGAFRTHPLGPGPTLWRLWPAVADWPARVIADPPPMTPALLGPWSPATGTRPGHAAVAGLLAIIRNLGLRLQEEATVEDWRIGILPRPPASLLQRADLNDAVWLPPRKGGGFRADPFGLETASGRFVFFEDCPAGTDVAGLAVLRLDDAGSPVAELPLETDLRGHLSWPFVFQHRGELWMLPEHSAGGHTVLLRCVRFPDRWQVAELLLPDVPAVDPVLFSAGDRFWLFATDRRDEDVTKLFIFYAGSLFGRWRPHPANPVLCDIRAARSAGPVFEADGALWRPAQDCSTAYGTAFVLCRIERLDLNGFRQRAVMRVAPPGVLPHGTHTLTPLGGNCSLVDAKRHRCSALTAVRRLARRITGAR